MDVDNPGRAIVSPETDVYLGYHEGRLSLAVADEQQAIVWLQGGSSRRIYKLIDPTMVRMTIEPPYLREADLD